MNYFQPLQHRPNPMRPLSIDQNTNAFHPQKAQQRIENQQTPCKCSWPKQFVALSFDWMALFFLWFYTWKLKIWWMLICSGTESDIGFSHMRGIPKTNESPIVTSWKVHLHQFQVQCIKVRTPCAGIARFFSGISEVGYP